MSELNRLQNEVSVARRELKNLRQEVLKVKSQFEHQATQIAMLISQDNGTKNVNESHKNITDSENLCVSLKPIGVISSCFKSKNGIPRQSSLCQEAKATLELNKTHFNNPEHSLQGLEDFSFIWILFYFHKNDHQSAVKAKIHPPRLDGATLGVFSTRSPHRPCAIGLSLVKLDKISGNKLYLSGVDLLDGTPVLDIKPYIEDYDTPRNTPNKGKDGKVFPDSELDDNTKGCKNNETECSKLSENASDINQKDLLNHLDKPEVTQKEFLSTGDPTLEYTQNSMNKIIQLINKPSTPLNVIFTSRAENDIEKFHPNKDSCMCDYCLQFIENAAEAKSAVIKILENDPRSTYRRKKCSDRLYFFEIDKLHVTAWFEENTAEILRVKPITDNAHKEKPGKITC